MNFDDLRLVFGFNGLSVALKLALPRLAQIFLSTPVGTVSGSSCFLLYIILKLWTHFSVTEERLSGLALMLIHRWTECILTPEELANQIFIATIMSWNYS